MMTWSCRVILRWRPASARSRVRRMSCWLGLRIAARMVVDDDDRGGVEIERAAHDLADVDRGFVDRALPHRLVGDQHVLRVEEEDADPLDRLVRHVGAEIVEQGLPRAEHRPLLDLLLEQPQRRRLGDLERRRRAFADLADPRDRRRRRPPAGRRSRRTRCISFLASGLVSRRGIGEAEQIFDELVVEQRVRARPRTGAGAAGRGARCRRAEASSAIAMD